MLGLNSVRLMLSRSTVHQNIMCRRYVTVVDRRKRQLLEKFESINSQVFTQLKESTKGEESLDWSAIKKQLIQDHPSVYNQFNFEVQLMQYLIKAGDKNDQLIQSFVKHVKQHLNQQASNKVAFSHVVLFLITMDSNYDSKSILSSLEELSRDGVFLKYPVVGKAWIEFAKHSPDACLKAIEFAKKHGELPNQLLTQLVTDALNYRLFKQAQDLLSFYKNRRLADELVAAWLIVLAKTKPSEREIEFKRMVQIFQEKRYWIPSELKHKFARFLKSLDYYCKHTLVDAEKCLCTNCKSPLLTLQEEEMEELRRHLKEKLVYKEGEVSHVSTPIEAENFFRFLDANRDEPFDLVVDGLNVSYYNTDRMVQEDTKSNRLVILNLGLTESLYETMIINKLFSKFKKILVVGRKHMSNWPSIKKLYEHEDQVKIFLLDNRSDDDVFLINAAVQSSKTYFWTADFLRCYKDLLDPAMEGLFEKWKFCRQVRFVPGSKKMLEFPTNVDYICQINEKNQIHFPVNQNFKLDKEERISAEWWCIGKSTPNSR